MAPKPDSEQRAAEAFAHALLPRALPQHDQAMLSAVHLPGSAERREGGTWGWPLGVRSSDLRPARVASLPNQSLLVLYTEGLVACSEGPGRRVEAVGG